MDMYRLKYAYVQNKPISDSVNMPKRIATKPIDKEWENAVKRMWWYHENTDLPCEASPCIFELRTRLLSLGGHNVCLPVSEPDLDNILERGQLWYGDIAKKVAGLPSQCHFNSAHLAKKTLGMMLCTGYALSDDGLWRQHSWCVSKTGKKLSIVETTTKRVAYFGFVLNDDETKTFCELNI